MSAVSAVASFGKALVRSPYRLSRRIVFAREGLNPYSYRCADPARVLSTPETYRLYGSSHFAVPNLAGFYHGILKHWWETYGLGERCLLVSETDDVKRYFAKIYPMTSFSCTDYYTDLRKHATCDVLWDLRLDPPEELRGVEFASVICQATLEHLVDPAGATRRLATMLDPGGYLYLHTSTPGARHHAYPSDYVRFWPEWFTDLPTVIPDLVCVESMCLKGDGFAVYVKQSPATQVPAPAP